MYSINIDLCTGNYHIQVIDVRSYNKDSYHIPSHSQATLLVGIHLILPTLAKQHTHHWYILVLIIGGESMLMGSIIDVFVTLTHNWYELSAKCCQKLDFCSKTVIFSHIVVGY